MKNLIKNKSRQKILLGTAFVIVLVSVSGFALSKTFSNTADNAEAVSDKKVITVQTKEILPKTVSRHISVSAIVKPSSEAKVSSKMTGNVAGIYFKEGDQVNAGQTIIRLERDRTLLTAYHNAQVNLDNTRAAMKKDKKVAKVMVETSSGDAKKQAKAGLSSVKKKAELQIAIAQGQLDSAQAQLGNTVIKAPISGAINKTYAEVGEMVMAGSPVVNIINAESIEVELALTEFDIGKISIKQEAEINLAAYPDEKFIGKVYYVGSASDPINKKFPVKIKLENEDGKIKPGMIAKVNIITARQENVLVIPKTAVFMDGNVEKVYLIDDDSKIKIITVKTESLDDNKLNVVEGLVENDEVVINGNYELEKGEEVMVRN